MASRMLFGSKPMVLTVSEAGGVRWGRKADQRNRCIGDAMRGKKFKNRAEVKAAFIAAKNSCKL